MRKIVRETMRYTVPKHLEGIITPVCDHYARVYCGPELELWFIYTIFDNEPETIEVMMTGTHTVIRAVCGSLSSVTKANWSMQAEDQ